MKDGPRKLGKSDPRKSKIIDLDDLKDLKDKAKGIKDKNRDILKGKGKRTAPSRKENPPRLGKSDGEDLLPSFSDELKRIPFINDKKDKNRDIVKGKGKRIETSGKEYPPRLGKSDQENILTLFTDELKRIPFINDKRVISAVLIIIFIGVVGVLAANSFTPAVNETNNTTIIVTPPENHFDNGLISFDYPKSWNVTNGTKAPVVVTVSKDENNSFVVMNEDLDKTSFTDRVLLWRQNIMQSGDITSESNITIDNTTGYNIEASYKVNNTTYNVRGVAVAQDDTIYFVMFIFNQSPLDYKDDMDLVINSFHIIG